MLESISGYSGPHWSPNTADQSLTGAGLHIPVVLDVRDFEK
jgi:hypothetical protein